MLGGYVSAAILLLSGLAGIAIPDRVATALLTRFDEPRGRLEFRVAYATFAGLGAWALAIGDREVFIGIGFLWLGAAAVRLIWTMIDRPRIDATYWAYLALELGLGAAGVFS